jgi:hypothetical protein
MITAPKEKADTCLAVKSLQIAEPSATWIAEDEVGNATLKIDPTSLVINELPNELLENDYTWQIPPEKHREYCEAFCNSDLEIHKELLSLFGLRLKNFRVYIYGAEGEIPLWDRKTEQGLELKSDEEKAYLHTDFDWSRRCSQPYVDRIEIIEGPGLVILPLISARLWYRRHGQTFSVSLSDHFNDHYAMHKELIPESRVIKLCKLWMYEDSEFDRVDIKMKIPQEAHLLKISYINLNW